MRLFRPIDVKTIRHALLIVFGTIQPRHALTNTMFDLLLKMSCNISSPQKGHWLIASCLPFLTTIYLTPRQTFGLVSFLEVPLLIFKTQNNHGKTKLHHNTANGNQPQEA